MNNRKVLIMVLMLIGAILFISCGKSDQSDKTKGTTETAVEKAETGSEAVAGDFTAMKDEFVAKAKETVDSWSSKVGDLVTKKEGLPELAQKPLEDPMKTLTDAKDKMVGSYGDLTNASEDNFDEKKTDFNNSVKVVEDSYNNVVSLFK